MDTSRSVVIIWCDISFENEQSYKPMKDEFTKATEATSEPENRVIDKLILEEDRKQLCSNAAPLITVQTADDAKKNIELHKEKKIFVISSGTVGRYLIPEILGKYPTVHDFYIFAHNKTLYRDFMDDYRKCVQIFNFPTDLLLRLTRDISSYFIERGKMYLQLEDPTQAWKCFHHARRLEIYANRRDHMDKISTSCEKDDVNCDFRENLDLLEGENRLLDKALKAIKKKGDAMPQEAED